MRISDWSSDVCSSDLKVAPSAAIGLPAAVAAIKEDSTDNVVEFSASAENLTDELTSIVIELPNVAGGDVDIATINTALIGIGSARSEEHTSELQSLMRNSYAVFCLKKKKKQKDKQNIQTKEKRTTITRQQHTHKHN